MSKDTIEIKELKNKLNSYVVAIGVEIVAILGLCIYSIINNLQTDIYFSLIYLFFTVLNIMEYVNSKKSCSLLAGILFGILLILRLM